MKCKNCSQPFQRRRKRTDKLILCNPCFDGFVAGINQIEKAFRRLQMDEHELNECQVCHMTLEPEDIMAGKQQCRDCQQISLDVQNLLSLQYGQEEGKVGN